MVYANLSPFLAGDDGFSAGRYKLESQLKGLDHAPKLKLSVKGAGDDDHHCRCDDKLTLKGFGAIKGHPEDDDDHLEPSGVYSLRSLAKAIKIKAKAKAEVKFGEDGLKVKAKTDVKVDVDAMKVLAAITGRDKHELQGMVNHLEINVQVSTESVVSMVQEAPPVDVERAAGQLEQVSGVAPELGDRYLSLLGPMAQENPEQADQFMDGMDLVFARQASPTDGPTAPGMPQGPFSPYQVSLSAETNAAVSVFVQELEDGTLNARIDVSVHAYASASVHFASPIPQGPEIPALPPGPVEAPGAALPAATSPVPIALPPSVVPVVLPEIALPVPEQADGPASPPEPGSGEEAADPIAGSVDEPPPAVASAGDTVISLQSLFSWQSRLRVSVGQAANPFSFGELKNLWDFEHVKSHLKNLAEIKLDSKTAGQPPAEGPEEEPSGNLETTVLS